MTCDGVAVTCQCNLLLVECDRSTAAKHLAAATLVTERQNWGGNFSVLLSFALAIILEFFLTDPV